MPEFVKLDSIYLDTMYKVIFVGRIVECLCYSEHFHAWLLDVTNNSEMVLCFQKICHILSHLVLSHYFDPFSILFLRSIFWKQLLRTVAFCLSLHGNKTISFHSLYFIC